MHRTPLAVVYHAGCSDGLGGALAVKAANPQMPHSFIEGRYDREPPYEQLKGQHVYLVDFSYSRDQLMKIVAVARTVTILDHHKTAQEDLTPFIARDEVMEWTASKFETEAQSWQRMRLTDNRSCFIRAKFDMKKSGAVLAWEHFHPGQPVPLFFQYLQDRDLWTKKLPDCDTVAWGLKAFEPTLTAWNEHFSPYLVGDRNQQQHAIDKLVAAGESVKGFTDIQVEAISHSAHPVCIQKNGQSFYALACNAPGFMASELGGFLANRADNPAGWGATYSYGKGGMLFSLRSRGSFDVGELAKGFSCNGRGGGHAPASGFEIENLSRVEWDEIGNGERIMTVFQHPKEDA